MLQVVQKIAENGELWKRMLKNPTSRRRFLKSLFFVAIFLGITIFLGREIKETAFFTPEKIIAILREYWYIAWLLQIVLTVITVMSPLPDSVAALAGGFVFGPFIGSLLTITGETLGAALDFFVARILGRNFVKRRFPKTIDHIDYYSKHLGWQTVFLLRLFPSLTFDVLSYAAGISSLSFRSYILATLCGIIPLAFITNILGHSIDTHSPLTTIIAIVAGAIIIIGISLIFHKFFPQNKTKGKIKKY